MRVRMRRFTAAMALLLSLPGLAHAQSHGKAVWLTESAQVQPGQTLKTAVRLALDPDWHVYWNNPGDAGMPTAVVWELPPGWHSSELKHLWPHRFKTGDLHGFGHEGEVWYPVTVTAPKDFSGKVTLKGKLSWLACNDDACVPGSADLVLEISAGVPQQTGSAAEVVKVHERAPKRMPEVSLLLGDDGDAWILKLVGEQAEALARGEFLAASPEVFAPEAEIRFAVEAGPQVRARVPKSRYAKKSPKQVDLWVLPEGEIRPQILVWKAPTRD